MADGCLQIWSIGTITIGENPSAQRQASLSTTLAITSPIQNTAASNPDLRGEKPATNRLSYNMVCYGAFQSSWQFQNTPVEYWEVIGYRSGVADLNVPGYNARSRGNQFPTFRDTAVISSSGVEISKKNTADIFTVQFFYNHLHKHVLAFPSLPYISKNFPRNFCSCHKNLYNLCHVRLQLKCDGTQWRKGGEVKAKLANGVGSQYSSHCLGTWYIQHYYRWRAHLGCQ